MKITFLFQVETGRPQIPQNENIEVFTENESTDRSSFHSSGCVRRLNVVDVVSVGERRSVTRRLFAEWCLGKSHFQTGKRVYSY